MNENKMGVVERILYFIYYFYYNILLSRRLQPTTKAPWISEAVVA